MAASTRFGLARAVDDVHVPAIGNEIIDPAVAPVRSLEPVCSLTATAMDHHDLPLHGRGGIEEEGLRVLRVVGMLDADLRAADPVASGGVTALHVGRPGDSGWEFSEEPGLADSSARLLDIYEGNVDEIEFVKLPVEVR